MAVFADREAALRAAEAGLTGRTDVPFPQPPGREPVDFIPEAPRDGRLYGRINRIWEEAVAIRGSSMTGELLLADDPEQDTEAATKRYVDALRDIDGGTY